MHKKVLHMKNIQTITVSKQTFSHAKKTKTTDK